jgi:UDP-GlcNAc:undecaprenyl-phosphate GlcNAc-1-phosphate transferase
MRNVFLKITFDPSEFKLGVLAFVTATIVALLLMPPLIRFIQRYRLFDVPDQRKEHSTPVPTMGGIASGAGMTAGCALWFSFSRDYVSISLFFSMAVLFVVGIMDDLRNMPARYKLAIQVGVASLVAFSGLRITSFNGLFDIYTLPVTMQYIITILAIAGITNAFNLIDGIDGLAGGLGFMSLIILGLFLTLSGDANMAIIAFALAGGLLGFLYFNFNPARIFMGDTGSLVLGFVVAVLCVRLIQNNTTLSFPIVPHAPVFALSIVAIPVFDTLRVFAIRLWRGKSPFTPGRDHIHHLLTNNGLGHRISARLIFGVHAVILMLGYFLKNISQSWGLAILLVVMLAVIAVFQRLRTA